MERKNNKLQSPSIYIQAVVAVLLVQIGHKVVREIQGSIAVAGTVGFVSMIIITALLIISIILLLVRNRLGIFMALFCGITMLFQPVVYHGISGIPEVNGVWWYSFFSFFQGVLIVYFSIGLLINEGKLQETQKPMSWFAFNIMRIMMGISRRKSKIENEMGALEIKSGSTVLDFGCGPGYNTIPASCEVGRHGKVFALDISPEAIKLVKNKSSLMQLSNISFIHSDCKTGLDDNSVDFVFLHNVLPMTEHPIEILEEISRVIKPEGKLSYKSGGGSRMAAKNSMSDTHIINYLEDKLNFEIVENTKGPTILKKKE